MAAVLAVRYHYFTRLGDRQSIGHAMVHRPRAPSLNAPDIDQGNNLPMRASCLKHAPHVTLLLHSCAADLPLLQWDRGAISWYPHRSGPVRSPAVKAERNTAGTPRVNAVGGMSKSSEAATGAN